MNDEITVDIKDLLLRICLKWRLILIWMLAGCVLFSGYGLIQSAREVSTARHHLEEQMAAGGPIEGEELIIVPKLQIWRCFCYLLLVGNPVCGIVQAPCEGGLTGRLWDHIARKRMASGDSG